MSPHFEAGTESAAVMPSDAKTSSALSKLKPFVVDLDGTLICSELLAESVFAHLGCNSWRVVSQLSTIRRRRVTLNAEIAAEKAIDDQAARGFVGHPLSISR
jgi:hypothetical protein